MATTLTLDEVLASARSRTACTKRLVTPTRRAPVKIQAPEIIFKNQLGNFFVFECVCVSSNITYSTAFKGFFLDR